MSSDSLSIDEEILATASEWVARRNRGLTAAEQDAYLEWLYRAPQHGAAVVHLERVSHSLNKLEHWRPQHSAQPNPDLLAPSSLPRRTAWAVGLAASLALLLWVGLPFETNSGPVRREPIIHPGAERQVLPDGSIVELNRGAAVEVAFTATERRVLLKSGEAHFSVAKNPQRPFFVDTGKVSVRAVGTAFAISLAGSEVAVLVTEGKVAVVEHSASGAATESSAPIFLTAGQRAVVETGGGKLSNSSVEDVTPAEIDRAMSWQNMRLEFVDIPLRDVVMAFNRYNRQQLVIANEETAAIVVGGNFRVDNIDAFVRLMDASFGVSAFRVGDQITLRKTH